MTPALIRTRILLAIGLLTAALSGGCNEPKRASPVMDALSNMKEQAVERSAEIKRLLDSNRHWTGGHSPVPSRTITLDTLATVRRSLTALDAEALVELTLDDRVDIRNAAVRLLIAVEPQPEVRLASRLQIEAVTKRRERLEAALFELRLIRVSTQPPAPASSAR